MKAFVNTLLTLIVLCAFLSACWLGVKTGNYWTVIFILFVVLLYFFLTWSFQKNSLMHVVQQFSTNTLIGLAILGMGFMTIWLGISEISTPIDFSRTLPHLAVNLIRNTVGSIGVSLLMWWFGGIFISIAINRLRANTAGRNN